MADLTQMLSRLLSGGAMPAMAGAMPVQAPMPITPPGLTRPRPGSPMPMPVTPSLSAGPDPALPDGGLLMQSLGRLLMGEPPAGARGGMAQPMRLGPPMPAGGEPAASALPWRQPGGVTASPRPRAPMLPRGDSSGGWGEALSDIALGAAVGDPRDPPAKAFMTGFSGAQAARQARADQAEERRLKAEDRRIAAEDRAFERQGTLAERSRADAAERRAQAKEKRDAQAAEISNAKAVMEIMKLSDPGLTREERFKVESEVNDYAKAINPNGLIDGPKLANELNAYRQQLEARITGQGGGAPAPQARPGSPDAVPQTTPGAPPTAAPVPPPAAAPAPAPRAPSQAAPVAPSGDGSSRQSPAKPTDAASFNALPVGAWFINPKDGRVMQKARPAGQP